MRRKQYINNNIIKKENPDCHRGFLIGSHKTSLNNIKAKQKYEKKI